MDKFYNKILEWTFYNPNSVILSAVMPLRMNEYRKYVG
jgi:hypothetical protein